MAWFYDFLFFLAPFVGLILIVAWRFYCDTAHTIARFERQASGHGQSEWGMYAEAARVKPTDFSKTQ